MKNEFDNDFIKAHINTIILSTLISGEKYGYEIAKAIKEKTNNEFELKQPTMYAGLRRLEQNGFIRSNWQDSEIGGKRHYYALTEKGVKELEKNKEVWSKSLGVVSSFFGTSVMSSEAIKQNDEIENDIKSLKEQIENQNSIVLNNTAPLLDNEKFENEKNEEVYNVATQSNFLDELEERTLDYSSNLAQFKDAINKLNSFKDVKNNNQSENFSFVNNEVNFINNSNNVVETKESEISLFDIIEKNKEYENKTSDATFLAPNNQAVTKVNIETYEDIKSNLGKQINSNFGSKKEKAELNDAVFISNESSSVTYDLAELQKKQLENTFKSDDFNLEINYVSTPIKFDKVAKKALLDEKQFEKNILDKRYVISNSTKWANIKVPSKFYNKNKLNFVSLLTLLPLLFVGFLASFLVAYYTKTVTANLYKSYAICFAIFMFVLIYFVFMLFICPNKKAVYKKNLNILYAFLFAIAFIAIIIAIFNFKFNVSLFNNAYTYLWLNPSMLALSVPIYYIIKQGLLTTKRTTKGIY